MKRTSIFYILLFTAFAIIISSCSDDFGIKQTGRDIKEGIPVTIPLSFNVKTSKQISRAAESDEAEKTINYLYVIAFNSDGSLDNHSYIPIDNKTGNGTVKFEMTTGVDKRIYAIGNPLSGSGSLTEDYLDQIKTESELLKAASNLREPFLITRSYFLMSGKMNPDSPEGTIDVDVKAPGGHDGIIYGTQNPKITLQRVDSRITFKVKGENAKYDNFSFVADRYWVCNIPQGTYVFPKKEDYVKEDNPYASMTYENAVPFEGENEEGYNVFEFYLPENRLTPQKRITSKTITKPGGKTYEAESMYALRERREKTKIPENPNKPGQIVENGAFEYANPNSAYVMFHGTLSYTDNSASTPKFVSADVTFTVHLGNTGLAADANKPEKVNNYDTERNTHYTYTVKVTDINSLKVEVESDEERRPGMEGDVIIAGAKIASMDSHYGRAKFELTRKAIKDGLSWAISTHFQQGMKVFVADDHKDIDGNVTENLPVEKLKKLQTDKSLNDYKWVQFAINREAIKNGLPVPENQFVKYPGYAAYSKENQTEAAPAFNHTQYNGGHYYDKAVTLYDVNQLINHLYVEANNPNSQLFVKNGQVSLDEDATVTFTAFIDEYVYKYNPTESFYEIPDNVTNVENLKLWKEVVNGENRMLHFCTSGNIYADDGETSLSQSVITISQKPIYSFYNTKSNATTAWGTESIEETGRLKVTGATLSATHPNSNGNGRENTLNIVQNNLHWTDVLNVEESAEATLKEGYNNIWYACLLRNRDLNGDDIVQENEIRWYLASVDQLTDLWIGQGSLNDEAWLYPRTLSDYSTRRHHVASSSYYDGNSDNPWVIWGEEGASRGGYKNQSSGIGGNGTSNSEEAASPDYDYRCVRNLGLSLDNISTVPEDYVIVTPNTYNNGSQRFDEYVLDLSRLESNSLRGAAYANVEQPNHNERIGETNKPYKKMAVLRGVPGSGEMNKLYPDSDHDWYYYQTNRVCPDGYRTPNQRELMLLYTTLNNENSEGYIMDWSQTYIVRTGFGFNGYSLYPEVTEKWDWWEWFEHKYASATWKPRPGFVFAGNNLILETSIIEHGKSPDYTVVGKTKGKIRCVRDVTE